MVYSLVAKFLGQSRGIIQLFLVLFFSAFFKGSTPAPVRSVPHFCLCFPFTSPIDSIRVFRSFRFPDAFHTALFIWTSTYNFLFINIVLLLCVSFSARHKHYYSRCMCVSVCCVCTVSKLYVCFMFVLENI